mgnify:CR=1 FL=1
MKIGIVSNLYPPDVRGGAELVAQRIAWALYERGHEVFVLTTQPFEGVRSLFPRIRERTVEAVYRFYPLNFYYMRRDQAAPFPIRALWHLVDLVNPLSRAAIRQVIQDENPDVIFTHNLKGIGVSIGGEIQRQGVPHVHTLHDVQLSVPSGLLIAGEEERWLNRSFLRRWYERLASREIGRPDLVLSPSKFLADFYRARGMFKDTRLEVLANPLPSQRQVTVPKERIPGSTRFLYVGQLEEHKGVRLMLEALDACGEGFELHVAGEGTLATEMAARAKRDPRVFYHGFVSFDHVVDLLKVTDAALVPSVCYENSPTVIYESFMVGVPVIGSRIGGIPELIQDGETGLLVESGSVEALTRAMRRIHDEREVWWGKTDAIRAHAKQYSIERYIDRLEDFMRELA